jgi:hypothetical protein
MVYSWPFGGLFRVGCYGGGGSNRKTEVIKEDRHAEIEVV